MGLLALVFAMLAAGTGEAAAAPTWSVLATAGTVLVLNGDQWTDLAAGEKVEEGAAIRTLRRGKVTISHLDYVVALGPEAAVRVDEPSGDTTVITQFAGAITVRAKVSPGHRLIVRTPSMIIHLEPGTVRLTILAEAGRVSVAEGRVKVVDLGTDAQITLGAGQEISARELAAGVASPAEFRPRVDASRASGPVASTAVGSDYGNGDGRYGRQQWR